MGEKKKPIHKTKYFFDWKKAGLILLVAFGFYFILNFGYIAILTKYKTAQITQIITSEAPSEPTGPPELAANELAIPALNIRTPILFTETVDEDVFQELLRQGVVHYPDTAEVGAVGNAYIFGHSSDFTWVDNSYRYIFALLPNIKLGDDIYATNQAGHLFHFQVKETFVISPSDLRVLNQETDGKIVLTLQTSYPFGTALARFIVVAELVEL
ncbi:MAG: sortase [Patescibacteria group bacterium]|jgi:LPXTG-site transpeptidase (sortase) family protein